MPIAPIADSAPIDPRHPVLGRNSWVRASALAMGGWQRVGYCAPVLAVLWLGIAWVLTH